MPSLEWNLEQWASDYRWTDSGSEWSGAWGSDDMEWFGVLLPRIHHFFPSENILEIAPGFGRWTGYLRNYCRNLIAVDISPKCIDFCKSRFSTDRKIRFHLNDGRSLSMIENGEIDFVFSFDSLVHCERDIIEGYLEEIERILKPDGVAFLHHSNLADYKRYYKLIKAVKRRFRERRSADVAANHGGESDVSSTAKIISSIRDSLWIDGDHSRALSMSADEFRSAAHRCGLKCIAQEKINWGTRRLIDCISIVGKATSNWPENRALENGYFMREAKYLKNLAVHYQIKL